MTGEAVMLEAPKNKAVIDLLEQTLREARAGRISSVAVITVSPFGNVATPWATDNPPMVYVGADLLKAGMLNAMTGGNRRSVVAGG